MRVTLNCHRAGHAPGETVDLPDGDAAVLLHFGAATPAQDAPAVPDAQQQPAPATPDAGKPGPAAGAPAASAPADAGSKAPGQGSA